MHVLLRVGVNVVNHRTISEVEIGTPETLIRTLLESPCIAWKSHWLALVTEIAAGETGCGPLRASR